MTARFGITIPFPGVRLADHAPWFQEFEQLGYTDVWTSESNGADAFTPLALASVSAPTLRLGTAIVPVFTRGPALLAQSAASMAASPGLGLRAGCWRDVSRRGRRNGAHPATPRCNVATIISIFALKRPMG